MKRQLRIGNYLITLKKGFGLSKANYYHLPLLTIGWGRNGVGIHILGLFLGVAKED